MFPPLGDGRMAFGSWERSKTMATSASLLQSGTMGMCALQFPSDVVHGQQYRRTPIEEHQHCPAITLQTSTARRRGKWLTVADVGNMHTRVE